MIVFVKFGFYRYAYMRRLDKPSKRHGDNLPNFAEKRAIPCNLLFTGELSGYMACLKAFFWSCVFHFSLVFLAFHVHLKPSSRLTAGG